VLAERGAGALLPNKREITVVFADLSGFTRYSELASAEDTVATLTHYLDELVRIAHLHDGTIDKFMGDEIMVLFGTPLHQENHAARAIACASDMQLVVGLLNEERARRGLPTLGLTVGVNSGDCVVGNVGGESRVQFSAIGDAINVAKRIQGLASRGDIVVGEESLRLAGLSTEGLEEHFVKGRGKSVRMRRIGAPEAPSPVP
jgi:adenylate cyclase